MEHLYTKNKSIISKYAYMRRIAVDFDGPCAQQTGDYYQIGEPTPGARDLLSNIRELGWYVVIWTSRVNALLKEELSQSPNEYPKLMMDMLAWLEKYDFPYDEIWMGGQKPPCSVFIDDRAYRFYVDQPDKSWREIFNQIIKSRGVEWKKLLQELSR